MPGEAEKDIMIETVRENGCCISMNQWLSSNESCCISHLIEAAIIMFLALVYNVSCTGITWTVVSTFSLGNMT